MTKLSVRPRVVCTYDDEGVPVFCGNRKYMGGNQLSSFSRCEGCEWETQDLFHGSNGKELWQWYCRFVPPIQ